MIHLASFASAHFTSSLRSLFQLFLLFGCLDLPFTSPAPPSALSCPSAKAVTPLHLHFSFSPPDRRTKERKEGRKRPRRLSHQERQNPPYAPLLPLQAYYYCSTPPPRTNGPSCTLATRGQRKSQRGGTKKPSQKRKSMKYLRPRKCLFSSSEGGAPLWSREVVVFGGRGRHLWGFGSHYSNFMKRIFFPSTAFPLPVSFSVLAPLSPICRKREKGGCFTGGRREQYGEGGILFLADSICGVSRFLARCAKILLTCKMCRYSDASHTSSQ